MVKRFVRSGLISLLTAITSVTVILGIVIVLTPSDPKPITATELAGRWSHVNDDGEVEHIYLEPDMSATVSRVPAPNSGGSVDDINRSGRWSIDQSGTSMYIFLDFPQISEEQAYAAAMRVTGDVENRILAFVIGDPDEGISFDYHKVQG